VLSAIVGEPGFPQKDCEKIKLVATVVIPTQTLLSDH